MDVSGADPFFTSWLCASGPIAHPLDLEFITMSLENGIVLPGITRDSIINLLNAHAKGENIIEGLQKEIRVVERDIGMPELVAANEDGSLKG
jgi:branched-chain amino acid aminotransferase